VQQEAEAVERGLLGCGSNNDASLESKQERAGRKSGMSSAEERCCVVVKVKVKVKVVE